VVGGVDVLGMQTREDCTRQRPNSRLHIPGPRSAQITRSMFPLPALATNNAQPALAGKERRAGGGGRRRGGGAVRAACCFRFRRFGASRSPERP
jgi:hypothetical protein